jgi:hypothetical protein
MLPRIDPLDDEIGYIIAAGFLLKIGKDEGPELGGVLGMSLHSALLHKERSSLPRRMLT